jgi:hypothetical protein
MCSSTQRILARSLISVIGLCLRARNDESCNNFIVMRYFASYKIQPATSQPNVCVV